MYYIFWLNIKVCDTIWLSNNKNQSRPGAETQQFKKFWYFTTQHTLNKFFNAIKYIYFDKVSIYLHD